MDELVEEYGDPFDLAVLNDLGGFVAKHPVRFGWWLGSSLAGFVVFSCGFGFGIMALVGGAFGTTDAMAYVSVIFMAVIALCCFASSISALRRRHKAAYLFDAGFVFVPGAGRPVRVVRWSEVTQVRKTVQVRQGARLNSNAHWVGYEEAVTYRDADRNVAVQTRTDRQPARVGPLTRIQYHIERADGVNVLVSGGFKNAFEFGQTALAKACRG